MRMPNRSCPGATSTETRFLPETGFLRYAVAALAGLLTLAAPLSAQPDDEELEHGLVAVYSGGMATVRRIDADIACAWNSDAPDAGIPDGPFSAEWTGQLLIRDRIRYTFHAYCEGSVEVRLNDQVVLSGEQD